MVQAPPHGDRGAGGCSGITSPAGDKPQSSTASGLRPYRQPGAAASRQEVPGPFLIVVLGGHGWFSAWLPASVPPSWRSPAPMGLLSTLPPPRGERGPCRSWPCGRMRCGVAKNARRASTLHEIIIIIGANLALGETKTLSKTLSANSDVLAARITPKPMEQPHRGWDKAGDGQSRFHPWCTLQGASSRAFHPKRGRAGQDVTPQRATRATGAWGCSEGGLQEPRTHPQPHGSPKAACPGDRRGKLRHAEPRTKPPGGPLPPT